MNHKFVSFIYLTILYFKGNFLEIVMQLRVFLEFHQYIVFLTLINKLLNDSVFCECKYHIDYH